MSQDLFHTYFNYIGRTEVPVVFHRWALISLIGSLLGRDVWFPFGHKAIYPNQYVILTGTPGARKGTAIRYGTSLLDDLPYKNVTPNRAVKESFWGWMAEKANLEDADDTADMLDWEVADPDSPNEAYIAHDEFLDFVGVGDDAFITNLANLWDNLPEYEQVKTRGKGAKIIKPTINILSGMTPEGISTAFKALAMGGGFFSRVLFIHSDPTSTKITFPDRPDPQQKEELVSYLSAIQNLEGEIVMSPEVEKLIDTIYQKGPQVQDTRFEYYNQRRLAHLLKLITIIAVSRLSLEPTVEDCIYANTILYNAEISMPNALGEYGKGKNSEVAANVLSFVESSHKPLSMQAIWKQVRRDLGKMTDLRDILEGLVQAEKLQTIPTGGRAMFLPNKTDIVKWPSHLVDFTMLLAEEHNQ